MLLLSVYLAWEFRREICKTTDKIYSNYQPTDSRQKHDNHLNADQRTSDGPRTRTDATNFNGNNTGRTPEHKSMTDVLFSEKTHKGQNERRTVVTSTNEGRFRRTDEGTVEAHAETTIVCVFGLCTLSPKTLPAGVSCQHDGNIIYKISVM